ncbi:MAG: hypothetical protein MR601_01640 [Erysipelotrichaceae bacterium]|nr:hypothetical protein [Erysipelotrichaceae bacterium]
MNDYKLIKILLCFLMCMGIFFPATDVKAEDTLNVTLQIINLEGDGSINDKTDFWVKTPINAAADISISGTGASIVNPWVVLTVPKLNIINKPTFIDSQKAFSTIKAEDNDNWYVIYKFEELTGGTRMTFPFPFSFKEDPTRNNDTITVKLDIVDAKDVADKYNADPNTNVATILGLNKLYSGEKTYKALKQEFSYGDSEARGYNENRWFKIDETNNTYRHNAIWEYDVNSTAGETTTGNTGRVVPVAFQPFVEIPSGTTGTISYVYPANLKVVATLPEGVEPNITDNNFTFDSSTRELTYFINNPRVEEPWWIRYKPGKTFTINLNFKNKEFNTIYDIPVKYYVDFGLDGQRELPERNIKIRFKPIYFTPGGGFGIWKDNLNSSGETPIRYWLYEGHYTIVDGKIYDKREEQTENGLFYTINLYNDNNGSAFDNKENGIVSDVYGVTDILSTVANDNRTYYKYFQLGNVTSRNSNLSPERRQEEIDNVINKFNTQPNKLYGIKRDGSKVVIAENIQYRQKVEINDTSGQYVKLELAFESPIRLNNTLMSFYTQTFPSSEEVEKFSNGTYLSRQEYRGTSEALVRNVRLYNGVEDAQYTAKDNAAWAYTSLQPISPKSDLDASGNQTVPYSASGTYLDYASWVSLRRSNGEWGPFASEPISGKLIQLLPPAFNYVRKNSQSWYKNNVGEPEVIENFKNTGRTAVIYTIPEFISADDSLDDFYVSTKIQITPYAERGNNRIDSYFVYDKNNVITPLYDSRAYVDALDLDGDGNRNEKYLNVYSFVNYIPPLELIVKKQVGYEKNTMSMFATGDLGEEFYYTISVFNNTIAEATKAYVIDTLPYVGDHSIVSNQKGEYPARNSQFYTPLSRSIESLAENASAMERFEVFYQLTPQGSDLASVRDGAWVKESEVSDFSLVKSFKLQLKPGKSIASKEEVKIIIPSKIPYNENLNPKDIAVNSSAVSTDGVLYSEGNSVSITFEKYKVSGIIYKDLNKDGLIREDEEGIGNRTVELIDATTNTVVLDNSGNPITTKTDSNGKYELFVYKRGNYKVRFSKLDDEVYTSQSQNNNVSANNIETIDQNDTNKAVSYAFSLNPTQNTAIQNAGIVYDKRDINILKVSSDLDESGNKIVLKDAEFILRSKTNPAITFSGKTNQEGKLAFEELPFDTYEIEETRAPLGYEKQTTNTEVVVGEGFLGVIEISNKPIKRNVKFVKVDADNQTIKLENVKFGLFVEGNNTAVYEALSNTNGEVVFNDVAYGKYTLKEISTIEGYLLNTNEQIVNISENGADIDLGTITNSKIKGKVEITKKDADTKSAIENVVFVLKKNNAEIFSATTNQQGIALFNDIPYGEYTLIEKTAKEGYILSTREETIRITDNNTIKINDWENTIKKGKVTITKKDVEDNSPLSDVVFVLKQGNNEIYTATTNQQGIATFENVKYGVYVLSEKTAKTGYLSSARVENINIDENGKELTFDWTNEKIKSTVTLTKVDADDENVKLQGVKFGLFKDGITTPAYEAISDVNGVVTFNNVIYGNYKLKEISTLENYVLSTDVKDVNVLTTDSIQLGNISNRLKKSTVTLTKVDADDENVKLQGVKFGLFKDGITTPAYEAISDVNGVVTFNNVVYGNYKLKEISTLINYNLSTVEKDVSVQNDGETIDLGNITNTIKKGKVTFVKVDTDDTTKKLKGVKFALIQNGVEKYVAISDDNGVVTFNNVVYGMYKLKEIETIESHNLLTEEFDVAIDEDGKIIDLSTITNTIKKGSVSFKKVDADDESKPLGGVTFVLKQNDVVKYRAVSFEDGTVSFTSVTYGEYVLSEESTLINYNLSTRVENINIDQEAKHYNFNNWTNTIKKGSVKITKVDSEDNTILLNDTKFALKQNDEIKYELVTDENGIAKFDNVIYGDYKLIEVKAKEGYANNLESIDISIDEDGKVIEKIIENPKIKATIIFKKINGGNTGDVIKGAVFALYDKKGVEVAKSMSDDNGYVKFTDVLYGEYKIKEIEASEGYHLSDKVMDVKVTKHKEEINLGYYSNVKIVKGVKFVEFKYDVPNTASSNSMYNHLIVFKISLIILMATLYVKRIKARL